ncbi:hypothetical protein GUJ93_ZPchr0007g4803 [Zizania palustris]|uniref:Uncharacterized protein n=1 Tax=Zizania palustris TaxID=103762 RepID=A0A8J5TCG8_ZIZPA|nr:hypothetical protein GUJ93_ZPchr0007g4803 [Zizania palustris]
MFALTKLENKILTEPFAFSCCLLCSAVPRARRRRHPNTSAFAPCPSASSRDGDLGAAPSSEAALLRSLAAIGQCDSARCLIFLATNGNLQAIAGHRHLNNRNLSVFNEFSKQLKGEAKSNPEFQKSMKEFSEKLSVTKEDLKFRSKKTVDKIYRSIDDVWIEAEATSKKVTPNVKEKISAATEKVKESFRLGKEETSSCRDGSSEASKPESTEASSHSDYKSQDATSSYTLFNKLRSTLPSASPMVAEDVRERWETSDNPVVQKIQDLNHSIFEETVTAVSFREIRQRDPSFSLSDFVDDVQ